MRKYKNKDCPSIISFFQNWTRINELVVLNNFRGEKIWIFGEEKFFLVKWWDIFISENLILYLLESDFCVIFRSQYMVLNYLFYFLKEKISMLSGIYFLWKYQDISNFQVERENIRQNKKYLKFFWSAAYKLNSRPSQNIFWNFSKISFFEKIVIFQKDFFIVKNIRIILI